jgi:hypothetical protein
MESRAFEKPVGTNPNRQRTHSHDQQTGGRKKWSALHIGPRTTSTQSALRRAVTIGHRWFFPTAPTLAKRIAGGHKRAEIHLEPYGRLEVIWFVYTGQPLMQTWQRMSNAVEGDLQPDGRKSGGAATKN